MNKEFDKYVHSVRSAFPFFRKSEKRFFSDFCMSVNEYAGEHPDCTYEELETTFGHPKDIVIEYYNQMEPDVYFTILKRARSIRYVTVEPVFCMNPLIIQPPFAPACTIIGRFFSLTPPIPYTGIRTLSQTSFKKASPLPAIPRLQSVSKIWPATR